MNVHPDRHDDHPWRWHVGVAGALGSIAGIVVGGCLALLLARVIGIDQSVADYGSAYLIILGGAWAGGLMGGVIVLRSARDPLTVPTIVCLGLLLAVPAVVAAYEGESGPGWPSTGRILLYGILYVLMPMASLPLAYLLAGLARRARRAE